ncbi:MAG TPA: LON peptidase substrate-binding domain-containing protein [Steroidobacteraceae bacterium]|jgi:Lon protease-like protein|nr:LON peptidase substrate-binding domain-containing protein [Steroidobacteraceae bacterium]HNS28191.1 LON peptidase substrate-binding domain-containing protein [Steroidobacteraceae bacterium]
MGTSTELPLFPLGTVLFPGGPLPLRIFETRYVDMVRRSLREQRGFGVLWIRSGREAGEVAQTASVGTSARIVDFYQLPDGLLGLTCLGERKFRLLRRWQASDGLNLGEVEWLAPEPSVPVPESLQHLALLLRAVLPQLGNLYEAVPRHFGDASWVSARIAEILPIELAEKQACLELDDGVQRLARLAPLILRE